MDHPPVSESTNGSTVAQRVEKWRPFFDFWDAWPRIFSSREFSQSIVQFPKQVFGAYLKVLRKPLNMHQIPAWETALYLEKSQNFLQVENSLSIVQFPKQVFGAYLKACPKISAGHQGKPSQGDPISRLKLHVSPRIPPRRGTPRRRTEFAIANYVFEQVVPASVS